MRTLTLSEYADCPIDVPLDNEQLRVLADAFMEKFGGDSVPETRRNFEGYVKTIGPRKVYR